MWPATSFDGQMGHTNGNFRDARRVLAEQTIRRQPRGRAVPLNIFAETNVDSIVVL